MTTKDAENRDETEAYLARTFGKHKRAVAGIVYTYLKTHPAKEATALTFAVDGTRLINMQTYVKALVPEAVAWWQKECAAIAMLLD
jgi:hypothetical protein